MPAMVGAANRCAAVDLQRAAGVDVVTIVIRRGSQRKVRNVAKAVVRNARPGLPDRFRKKDAGSAAARRQPVSEACCRSRPSREYRIARTRRSQCWCCSNKLPFPSLNSVPPMAVTSGMLAGASTAKPSCAMAASRSSQSAAPASPAAASQVMPSALACCAIWRSFGRSTKSPPSQIP